MWELKGGEESRGMLSPRYDVAKAIINSASRSTGNMGHKSRGHLVGRMGLYSRLKREQWGRKYHLGH